MAPNLLPRAPLNLHRNAISIPTLVLRRGRHAAESATEPLAGGQRLGGGRGSGGGTGGGVFVGGEVDGAAGEAFAEFVDGLEMGGRC